MERVELLLRDLLIRPLLDLQFILYLENARHTLSRHIRQLTVHLIRDDALQCDMTVLHDDVDWRDRLRTVPEEWTVEAENCTV